MKRSNLTLLLVLFALAGFSQVYRSNTEESAFTGVLKEYDDIRVPVPWAKVRLRGTDRVTSCDSRGFFALSIGSGYKRSNREVLVFSADGYETLEYNVPVGLVELGDIYMKPLFHDINSLTVNDFMPPGADERLSPGNPGAVAVYWNKDDALASAADFRLGMMGYKIRGYDWSRVDFNINGASMNEPETGYGNPALIGGLNDVTANTGGGDGRLISGDMFYGGPGGYGNISINPLSMRRRLKASYSYGSGLFTHKISASYATGETTSGWGLFVAASARQGVGLPEATDFKGLSYFLMAANSIDEMNTFSFFAFGAPTERGMNNLSPQDTDARYNSAWGYDNETERNSRVKKFHQPVVGFSHLFDGDESMWRTSLAFSFGNSGVTGLNRTSNVPDPQNEETEQIEWDKLRTTNSIYDNIGSQYIVEAENSDRMLLTFSSVYDLFEWGNFATTAGADIKFYSGSFYKTVDDLLGGRYWSNVGSLNSEAGLGSKIGYDYSITQQNFRLWNMWKYFLNRFKFSFGGSASYVAYKYKSNAVNEKPENREELPRQKFFDYSGKVGVAYKVSKKSNLEINGLYSAQAPLFRNLYPAPQVSGETVPDIKNERIIAGEVNFITEQPLYSLRISGYYTLMQDQTICRSYYGNDMNDLMYMVLTGAGSTRFGGEVSGKISPAKGLSIDIAGAYGICKYTENPSATFVRQNAPEQNIDNETVNLNGLFAGSTPQTAFTAGLQYDSPKMWRAGFNLNYVGHNYSDINPLRYIDNGLNADFPDQIKFKGLFTVDLQGGYTYMYGNKRKKGISIGANFQNIFDNKSGILGVSVPFRIDGSDNYRYSYAYGRTMYIILSFVF